MRRIGGAEEKASCEFKSDRCKFVEVLVVAHSNAFFLNIGTFATVRIINT